LQSAVPPSGGSLEIGNEPGTRTCYRIGREFVPPSGGSLEIGNSRAEVGWQDNPKRFPLRGDP